VSSLALAVCAAVGVHLLFTAGDSPIRWRSPDETLGEVVRRRAGWALHRSGLGDVPFARFATSSVATGAVTGAAAATVFGAGLPAVLVGVVGSLTPAAAWRRRRDTIRGAARDAWPGLIEEVRLLTGSGGRSIPHALLEVGLRGPTGLRPAFEAAQREWALTTDFERTTSVLKQRLADPTADAACETLLVAAEVGGDVDRRLRALAEDRRHDLLGRKEAAARQAGARLARTFVVLVPAGMALAGLSVGDGAQAYRSPLGQALVAIGIALIIVCWWWASRIMRLPEPERVLDR
jgi:tight adherence protein B